MGEGKQWIEQVGFLREENKMSKDLWLGSTRHVQKTQVLCLASHKQVSSEETMGVLAAIHSPGSG